MSAKEIFALRKQGCGVDALAKARAEIEQNRQDVWFLRAYAWCLYDEAKPLAVRVKQGNLAPSALAGQFLPLMREFAGFAKPLRQDTAFSAMLRLANDVSRDWSEFLPFARWAGIDSFTEDDTRPFQTADGKTVDSLQQRFIRAICRETARYAADDVVDPKVIAWGEKVLANALQAGPDDQWLNYYQSRLFLAKGAREAAVRHLLPVLQRQSRAAWPWALLGNILEVNRPADALTCLVHAAQLARDEQEVANTRIRLADLLARSQRYGQAARQVQLAVAYRSDQGWRVPPLLQQLLDSDWYARVRTDDGFEALPSSRAEARQLLQELGRENLEYRPGVIDHVNRSKALSHVVIGRNKGALLHHRDFPDVAGLAIGEVIEVGLASDGRSALDWRRTEQCVPPEVCRQVTGTVLRREDQSFAFVRDGNGGGDVFVPPVLAGAFVPEQTVRVTCLAVWSTNKKGKSGWSALRIDADASPAAGAGGTV